MTQQSWRDSVPEESAIDLETLLGTGIGSAREQVEQNGGFLPFALVVENDGDVRLLAVSRTNDTDSGNPGSSDADGLAEPADHEFDANEMISDLTELLRQYREGFRAAALVCDITLVDEGTDAIHVASEHRDGSVFAAVLPYWPDTARARWQFGQLAADSNDAAVWVD